MTIQKTALLGLAVCVAACSSTAPDESDPLDGLDGSGSTGAGEDGVGDAEGDEGPAGTGDTGGGESDGSTGEPPDPGMDSPTPPLAPSCPDAWPEGWVFCEDFETILDPFETFSEYADANGAFTIDTGAAAMRVDYTPGVESTGWLLVALGRSPIVHTGGRTYAPGEKLEELYWRMRVKHQSGWPDVGPGTLTRATSLADEAWGEAFVAELQSTGTDTTLEAVASTCVAGTDVMCAGYNDEAALEDQASLVGATPLFSSALSGEWHCVEGHIRLNTPGMADGGLEFWIDDELEAERTDIDWRGEWTAYGINAIAFENIWPGGPERPLSRWIDDLVISTAPIGCD